MVGGMVFKFLSSRDEFWVRGTHRIDRSDRFFFRVEEGIEELKRMVQGQGGFDTWVNCIGVTRALLREGDPGGEETATQINASFPHQLAACARSLGARVIQISTDAVFSDRSGVCLEGDLPDAADPYGRSKALGEAREENFLSIRCSFVGPDPAGQKGLLQWYLSRPEGSQVKGFTDQTWVGVTTLQFARICAEIIGQRRFDALREESPVHHLCPNRPLTKCELLMCFEKLFQRNVEIVPTVSGLPVTRILSTRLAGLTALAGKDLSIEPAIREMVQAREREAALP